MGEAQGGATHDGHRHLPVTRDKERLAEALALERIHGTKARAYVAERISVLAAAGDLAGVERLRAIALYLDRLAHPPGGLN